MENATDELTVISTFFQTLAERANKENDLSDVTYAVCQSDGAFRGFFLKFFFGKKIKPEDVIAFEREHSEDMGRPDFWIETKNGEVFIVEVKIGDWNQHFDQYNKLLKKKLREKRFPEKDQAWDHLGYIANYKVTTTEKGKSVNPNCSVHTWHEFKLAIEESACCKNRLVAAYVKYLESICHFQEVKIPDGWLICGEDFKCFRKLVGDIDDAIGKAKGEWKDARGKVRRKWECKVYSRKSGFSSQRYFGVFFELMNFDRKGNSIKGWLGAYYTKEGVKICVEFDDCREWGKLVCDKFRQDEKMEDGALRFWIGGNASENILIEDFFRNVISVVVNDRHLTDMSEDGIEYAEVNAKCFKKEALAMQFLPYVLETQFLSPAFCNKLEGKGYTMELSEEEDQWSYCGKAFVLKSINSDSTKGKRHQRRREINGWIGVFFRDDGWGKNKNARGDSFKDRPAFVVEMDREHLGKKVQQRKKGVTWYKDDYDYGCHDIYIDNDGEDVTVVLDKARKVILDAL